MVTASRASVGQRSGNNVSDETQAWIVYRRPPGQAFGKTFEVSLRKAIAHNAALIVFEWRDLGDDRETLNKTIERIRGLGIELRIAEEQSPERPATCPSCGRTRLMGSMQKPCWAEVQSEVMT